MAGSGKSYGISLFYTHAYLSAPADGVVRLYGNYDPTTGQGHVQLVSSFRGLSEVIQMERGSGVTADWKQIDGTLLVGGDSRTVRVWDAHTETLVLVRNGFLPCTYG